MKHYRKKIEEIVMMMDTKTVKITHMITRLDLHSLSYTKKLTYHQYYLLITNLNLFYA